MRRLLLLRHAKTEQAQPGERDRDRGLTARGRSDAPLMGAYLVRHRLHPDLVLVSPAKRTQETWTLVAAAGDATSPAKTDDRIYNASADALADLIRETNGARALLIVGHNPGLHDLAQQLVGSGDAAVRAALREKLPTSGLVVIDFAFKDWSELHDRGGRLERFISPGQIAADTA